MPDLLLVLAAVCGALALALFVAGLYALKRRRLFGVLLSLTGAVLLLTLGALAATIAVATQGYRAFTHEEVAVVVETRPTGDRTFDATFTFDDGSTRSFALAGDELYVDAHILKWKPLGNLLGFHTVYELDRVAGRYSRLADEQQRPRTVYSLAAPKPVDLFELRRRRGLFRPLVDAEYGSATFVLADRPARFEVRVSTTGLLVRQVAGAPGER